MIGGPLGAYRQRTAVPLTLTTIMPPYSSTTSRILPKR